MNYLDMRLSPELLPESRRQRDRELERRAQIREALAARGLARPSRFAALTARMRRTRRPDARRSLAEGC
jgi:hypothetical protein